MANRRLSMRKIKEVLRLKWGNKLSNRQIAKSCSISHSTVRDYLLSAELTGLSWPLDPKLDVTLRQQHRAGEKLFLDYAGQTVPIIDPATGQIHEAQIFIAALGASNYTFAEATLGQDLPSWIRSHVHAFEFFGGVPYILVPDNLKAGVTNPCRYEPDISPTYQGITGRP